MSDGGFSFDEAKSFPAATSDGFSFDEALGVPKPVPEKSGFAAGVGKGAVSGLINGAGAVVSGVGDMVQSFGQDLKTEASQEDQRRDKILSVFDAMDKGEDISPADVKDDQGNRLNRSIFDDYKFASADQRAALRNKFTSQSSATGGVEDTLGGAAKSVGAAGADVGHDIQDAASSMLTDEERSRTSVKVSSMIGGLVPLIGASMAGGLPALIGVAGVQGYGEGYDEAKKAGQTDAQAARAGMMTGLVQGGLMTVPVHKAMEVMDALPGVAKNSVLKALVEIGKSSGTMVGFSELSKLADNAVAKATYDPNRDIMEGVGDDAGVEAAVGAILPVAGVGLGAAGRVAKRLVTPKAEPVKTATDVMQADNIDDAITTANEAAKTPIPVSETISENVDTLNTSAPNPKLDKLQKLFSGVNRGEVEKATDDTYLFKTKDENGSDVEVPLRVWDPKTATPGGETIPPEVAEAQRQYYEGEHGIDVVYFEDNPNITFDGVVDPKQPNTLFLSNNPSRNAIEIGAHEFKHVLGSTKGPDGESLEDILHQQVLSSITDAGWEYAKGQFSVTAPDRADFAQGEEGDAQHAQAVTSHLINEVAGDINGEALRFETFIPKVMEEVESRYGAETAQDMFRKFMDGIRAAMETLRSFFSDGENTISQHLVNNLDDIHSTLAKMWAAKYGEAFEEPAPGEPRAEGLQFSPKKDEFEQVEWKPDQPAFFSALQRAVEGLKMDKAPPGQWEATIVNMPGVKAEETAWSGVNEWLRKQTGPVTKEQVLQHLRDNDVTIGEVNNKKYTEEDVLAKARQLAERNEENFDDLFDSTREKYMEKARDVLDDNSTDFEQYTLPGGKNYKELLLTLPYRDGNFKSSHFPAVPNILAHIRFDDRTGPNGERILHIAEVQSDWHQKGRKVGYKGRGDDRELVKHALAARDAMFEYRERKIAEVTEGKYESKTEALDAGDTDAFKKIKAVDQDPGFIALADAHDAAADRLTKFRQAVPDAPFKTTWHELAMKRMLRYAAEHGYDRVTWDTGETNADRYDLSKQVNQILVEKFSDRYEVRAYDMRDNKIINEIAETPEKLAELIGKDAAEKAVDQIEKSKSNPPRADLRGLDLKVGGEGMHGFYDKILPATVNKLVKKWGGKVERADIHTGNDEGAFTGAALPGGGFGVINRNHEVQGRRYDTLRDAQIVANNWNADNTKQRKLTAPVHSIAVTPAMRESVMQGQPKFRPKQKGEKIVPDKTKEMMDVVPGLKRVFANLTTSEVGLISKRTADKLVRLFSDLPSAEEVAAVAFSGRAKRGWYQQSAQALSEVFGAEDAPRFTALLAALSPQTSVESNLENALRTWVNWEKAGRPQDAKTIFSILGRSVQGTGTEASVLGAWKGNALRSLTHPDPASIDFALSGAKVNSFALNLRQYVNEVTNDAWMATFAGLDGEALASARKANKIDDIGDSFGYKSPGYLALSAMVREASKILTRRTGQVWTPAEVQETVWSWTKTLYERRDRAGENRTAQQILKAADMTMEDVNSTPDFAKLLITGIYRKILEEGNYEKTLKDLERAQASDIRSGRITGPALAVTSAEGSGFAQPAFERHLQRAAGRLERIRTDRLVAAGVDPRDMAKASREAEIRANLSAVTPAIPGLQRLAEDANAGDEGAGRLVNLIAHESLERLVATIPGAELEATHNGGLYGGALEPSLGVKVSFPEKARGSVLAALAKFADNFNQEQIHVRQATLDPAGRVSPDGSYATPVYTFDLVRPLARAEVEKVIADSGLYGVTFNDHQMEAYFVGDPRDTAAHDEFDAKIERARASLGDRVDGFRRSVARLWAYGKGDGATQGYGAISGDVPPGTEKFTRVPRAIAERQLGREIELSDIPEHVTPQQAQLQRIIADHYEQLPDNDLENPNVKKSYDELAKELGKQYDALPVKVDVWDRQGEPYKSSADLRRDILDNNHMWIYATTPDTFGPAGEDFSGHPLLERSGRISSNDHPLLVNDELRAVHDYYAHMMTSSDFGPRGEEAAWRNHIATMDNAWARWALTSETRGQNSWVNFGAHVEEGSSLRDRPFARQKAALLPLKDTLSGNEHLDLPMYELMRELPEDQHRGSLPEGADDPFAEFSPRINDAVRERLSKIHPDFARIFEKPVYKAPERVVPKVEPVKPEPTKQAEKPRQRTLSTQHPEGKGRTIERALNGEETKALENEPQEIRAKTLVDKDRDRAMKIAMREEQPPKGLLPTFVYFELERRATREGDQETIDKLRESPLAKEVTTAARTVQSFVARDPQSAVAKIQEVEAAREASATQRVRGEHATLDAAKAAEVTKAVPAIKKAVKEQIKARPLSDWSAFIQSITCS